MKKNSKLRYVGLCAAALLLVAPVAAPALSAASNVSVVSAAVSAEDKAADDMNTYMSFLGSKTVTADDLDSILDPGEGQGFVDKKEFAADGGNDNKILGLLKAKNAKLNSDADISTYFYSISATPGASSKQAIEQLRKNGGSVNIKVTVFTKSKDDDTKYDEKQSNTYQLTYTPDAAATVVKSASVQFTAPLSAVIGDSTKGFEDYNGVTSDLKATSDTGASLNLGQYMTAMSSIVSSDLVSGGKFVKAGTAYQRYTLRLDDTALKSLDAKFSLADSSVNGVKFSLFNDTTKEYRASGNGFEVSATPSVSEDGAIKEINATVTRNINVTAAAEVPTEEKVSGVVEISYVPGYGIQVWDSYKDGKIVRDANGKAKKLAHGTAWKVFKKITIKGTTYYNLGGNQWVSNDYAKFSEK
ncbi:SLAP domain-containing protein [Lapidilactobacillus salsurivasis]